MAAAAPEARLQRRPSSVRVFLPLHRSTATRRLIAFPNPSPAASWLVVAAVVGALAGGGAAAVVGSTAVAKGKLTLIVVAAVAKGKLVVAVAVFQAAPRTAAVFPEHPHIEG